MSLISRSEQTKLSTLLEEQHVLVADGGMGTTLMALGLEAGTTPELWNVERRSRIAAVHTDFVAAGADIILTNTFGGTRSRLAHRGLADRTAELNSAAVAIARTVADAADTLVLVAGSIGPTGSLFAPLGDLEAEEAEDIFGEQVAALTETGVDLLWIETMSSIEELTAAQSAASASGIPTVATMSFDTHNHTMMGVAPAELARWWGSREPRPVAVGANCGIGPDETVLAVTHLTEEAPGAVVVAKSNCGTPVPDGTGVRYPIEPQGMMDYARRAIDAGARIIGACCGSTPEHIRVIRETVDRLPAET